MPVETDSPDPARGNPDQLAAEPIVAPQTVAPSPVQPSDSGPVPPAPSPSPSPSVDGVAPDPTGLPPQRGNGRSDAMTATTDEGVVPPPPPTDLPPAAPYVGPQEDTTRRADLDAAAGLPATPYTRPSPLSRRQSRRRRPGRTPAAPVEGRRVVHRLRQVSPWSVFKLVALFYLCVFLMFMVAGVLLWRIGRSTETIDQLEGLVTRLGAYGRCVPEAEVEPGTDFETDDDCPDGQVIIDGFRFEDGTLFRAALFSGVIFVVAGTAITVLLTVLLNLLNDVTGGVRYVTIREPTPERATGPPPGPSSGAKHAAAASRSPGY